MQLGNYDLVRLLGSGGMAHVYLARQRDLDRYVAIKILDPERVDDPDARALFLDEARLCALLCHQNLAIVYDAAVEGGATYIAMEYIDGLDLRELLCAADAQGRALPLEAAAAIVRAAAAGLDHAHERCGHDGAPLHLVHRDVSLSNIMVTRDGQVKVIDFGVASARVSLHVEAPGAIRGKPSYMAPEQCLGGVIDARSDVFALGVVLYELATGRACFDGRSDVERMLAVVEGVFVPPHVAIPGFPRDLERVITTALATDPARRYPSAAALIDALARVARTHGWTCDGAMLGELVGELVDEQLDHDSACTLDLHVRALRSAA